MLLIFLRLKLTSDQIAIVLRVATQRRFKVGVLESAVVGGDGPLQIAAFCQCVATIVLRGGIDKWRKPFRRGAILLGLELSIGLAARIREELGGTLRITRLKRMLTLLIAAIPKIRPGACLSARGEQYPQANDPRDIHSQPRRAISATDRSSRGSSQMPSLRQL